MKTANVLCELEDISVDNINIEIKKYLEKHSFSTMDILLRKREILSLEIDHLYSKIIEKKRGGYCFEHNKLFHYSLVERGLEVNKQLARVVYGKDIDAPRTHRINIVTIDDSDYLADVGFGAHTPNGLIPMSGEEVKCPNGNLYRVYENSNGLFSLEVLREEGFFSFYTFDMGVYQESDFNLSNYYSNTHPKSKHANHLVMSINKENMTVAIVDNSLSTFKEGRKTEEKIESAEHLQSLVLEYFYLDISLEEAVLLFEGVDR